MGRLDGKVAIVTGGGSGMGEAATRLFVGEGARVVIGDVQIDKAREVAGSLGDGCTAVRTDVTSSEEVRDLVATAVERFGKLDVMYNNAGGGRRMTTPEREARRKRDSMTTPEREARAARGARTRRPTLLADVDEQDWYDTVALNLHGVFLGMKHALPALLDNGGGSIITTASVSAFLGMHGQAAYGAAKGGVVQLTRVCAIEYADRGIRCNCICPGGTLTPLLYDPFGEQPDPDAAREQLGAALAGAQPIQRACLPEDIANAALWLAGDESSFVTGQAIVVDGGWMASARTPARRGER